MHPVIVSIANAMCFLKSLEGNNRCNQPQHTCSGPWVEACGTVRADLPEPVWAAALQVNWDRKVADLVEDIYGDHAYMVRLSLNMGFATPASG